MAGDRRRLVAVIAEVCASPGRVLSAAFLVALATKLLNVGIGGPQYMIDDFTLYEGGFLVWFGQAPPQHAFLECWAAGLCSLVVYGVKVMLAGEWAAARDGYFVGAALRDFYQAPDAYYAAYRSLLIAVDAATAIVVYKLARRVLNDQVWPAVWVTVLFLFTYNTLWSPLTGRPDTLATFAAAVGVYAYLRSAGIVASPHFWLAAVCMGLGAGLKLHVAAFSVFIALDLVRSHGIRTGVRPAVFFAGTAFFFFLVADGSLLFDPLVYVKSRTSTYRDDYSPYIRWGDQFAVMLRATGWITLPLALAGTMVAMRRTAPAAAKSVAFLALGWLLIFCTTRQLRGYWMLPAIPLLYVLAAMALQQVPRRRVRVVSAVAICAVLMAQTVALAWQTRRTDLNELRAWVTANVRPGERFYMMGDPVLRLPKDAATMRVYQTAYEREFASDLGKDMPFVERHLKNWEERSALRLFDMMGYRSESGYAFFNYRDFPPDKFSDLVDPADMDYLIVQQQFPVDDVAGLRHLLATRFELAAERRSEGGDGSGLMHRVYRRVPRRDARAAD